MTDIEPKNSENWISRVIEGGLPQLLAGPAGKALSQLLGAAVEIPAAYLHGFAQNANDKTEARSYISQQISKKAAEIAVANPAIMDRALSSMLSRSYRAQSNKDAIVALAIEDLQSEPPSATSEGPSDEWMMKFERYAEEATNADLRLMFSKLLTSEIRDPGKVSPSTLHFSSMLDAETAKLIDRVLAYQADEFSIGLDFINPQLSVLEKAQIEQSGFWSTGKSLSLTFSESGYYMMRFPRTDVGCTIKGKPDGKISFTVAILSRAGMELSEIVNKELKITEIAESINKKSEATEVYIGDIYERPEGKLSMPNPIKIRPHV